PLVGRPRARLVEVVDALDLEDVGAHVGEQRAAPGAGDDAGEIEHADTVEGERAIRHAAYHSKLLGYYDFVTTLREALGARILVLDGAMGTMIQAQALGPDDFARAAYE